MAHRSEISAVADDRRLARLVAVFASLGAALVHASTLPDHMQEWLPTGVFFAAIAAFQLAWAGPVAVWPSRRVLQVGVLVNAGAIALWSVSRTVGLPAGPHAGIAQPVSGLDLITGVLEVMLCVSALWCLVRRVERPFRSLAGYLTPAGTMTLTIAALTTAAFTGPLGEHTHTGSKTHSTSGSEHQQQANHDHPAGGDHAGSAPSSGDDTSRGRDGSSGGDGHSSHNH